MSKPPWKTEFDKITTAETKTAAAKVDWNVLVVKLLNDTSLSDKNVKEVGRVLLKMKLIDKSNEKYL